MLQFGGLHDAIMVASPTAEGVAVTVPPNCAVVEAALVVQPVAPTPIDDGDDEHQVNGTPYNLFPRMSITVALIVVDPLPAVTVSELPMPPFTSTEIDCTGHVV